MNGDGLGDSDCRSKILIIPRFLSVSVSVSMCVSVFRIVSNMVGTTMNHHHEGSRTESLDFVNLLSSPNVG